MIELSRGKLYLTVIAFMLLAAGVIAIYVYIRNYVADHRARKSKRKIYRKINKGNEYSKS